MDKEEEMKSVNIDKKRAAEDVAAALMGKTPCIWCDGTGSSWEKGWEEMEKTICPRCHGERWVKYGKE